MRTLNRYIFGVLLLAFVCNTFYIYLTPVKVDKDRLSREASNGKLIYQSYNCQSCHQFYGLGGYLGPDLTNVMSSQGKGEPWVRAMLTNGGRQMPKYSLTTQESDYLIAFLREMDLRGNGRPDAFRISPSGMIQMED